MSHYEFFPNDLLNGFEIFLRLPVTFKINPSIRSNDIWIKLKQFIFLFPHQVMFVVRTKSVSEPRQERSRASHPVEILAGGNILHYVEMMQRISALIKVICKA